jgi:hypothetical protein
LFAALPIKYVGFDMSVRVKNELPVCDVPDALNTLACKIFTGTEEFPEMPYVVFASKKPPDVVVVPM